MTNNNLQNTIQKTKDRTTQTSLKTGGDLKMVYIIWQIVFSHSLGLVLILYKTNWYLLKILPKMLSAIVYSFLSRRKAILFPSILFPVSGSTFSYSFGYQSAIAIMWSFYGFLSSFLATCFFNYYARVSKLNQISASDRKRCTAI